MKQFSGKDILRAALNTANSTPLASAASQKAFDPTPYLTECTNHIPQVNAATITDALKPVPLPHHKPYARRGVDVGVEVENALVFNFDQQVAPLVQVLVSKTLEQAVTEVREVQELTAIRDYKRAWEARRDAEVKEDEERLANEVKRAAKHAELVKDGKERLGKQLRLANKVKAMRISVQFVNELFTHTIKNIEEKTWISVPADLESVETVRVSMSNVPIQVYMPLLAHQACERISESDNASNFVSSLDN